MTLANVDEVFEGLMREIHQKKAATQSIILGGTSSLVLEPPQTQTQTQTQTQSQSKAGGGCCL